jgi:PPK2 family polyphosphate:nucleotide phosphotransferase
LAEDVSQLEAAQELLWASGRYAVLIILQARDAAGKDSTIKHVMTGFNPQGCEVHSFGPPSAEEVRHHFLWRPIRHLPARGRIAIFNRSYHEEILVVRVHPEFLAPQNIAPDEVDDSFWAARCEDINHFERTLARNGTCVIKFFLHVSKQKQKKRLLQRLNEADKHWKFSVGDLRERALWDDYTMAYEAMLSATSTPWAPWYIIPADKKWFTHACVADIVSERIGQLDLEYPKVTKEQRRQLQAAKKKLEAEKDG